MSPRAAVLPGVRLIVALGLVLGGSGSSKAAQALPSYDPSRPELESVLEDLAAWVPGEWSSFPQIHLERTVRMPAEGEHEHWYRTFARINAPQIGTHVFYGQINVGGRDGPLLGRSQVLYVAQIDESRQAVVIRGQPIETPEVFVNLQDRPQLWPKVRLRDPSAIKCDFLWRRSGRQLVGVLDGSTQERRKYGAGTCNYPTGAGDVEFVANSEWVLSSDELWVFDVNMIAGQRFIGRRDLTHTRLYRASPYSCTVTDASGTRTLAAHDRGFTASVARASGATHQLLLLRAWRPAVDGPGLDDDLRLSLVDSPGTDSIVEARAPPRAAILELRGDDVSVTCGLISAFPPMPRVEQPSSQ
jgi:hypothetical protein